MKRYEIILDIKDSKHCLMEVYEIKDDNHILMDTTLNYNHAVDACLLEATGVVEHALSQTVQEK